MTVSHCIFRDLKILLNKDVAKDFPFGFQNVSVYFILFFQTIEIFS